MTENTNGGLAVASNPQRSGSAGFTIMELIVIAGLGGLLAAISFPSLSSALSAHQLMAGLRETANAIRAARGVAVARNQQARVVVSGGGTTINVETSPDGTTWTSLGQPLVLESGVTVSAVSPSDGLVFASRGTLSSAVSVTMRNSKGDTRQLSVSLLGAVDLS